MLVLNRKLGERVILPQCRLSFTILRIRGKTVRVGICAPSEVKVLRGELWDRGSRRDRVGESIACTSKPIAHPRMTRHAATAEHSTARKA